MGCIYTGIRIDGGHFKIGMTKEDKPTTRYNANHLMGLYYLSCPKATTSELLLLESCARVASERIPMFQKVGTDWFVYNIDQYDEIGKMKAVALSILEEVAAIADDYGIEYQCFSPI